MAERLQQQVAALKGIFTSDFKGQTNVNSVDLLKMAVANG